MPKKTKKQQPDNVLTNTARTVGATMGKIAATMQNMMPGATSPKRKRAATPRRKSSPRAKRRK